MKNDLKVFRHYLRLLLPYWGNSLLSLCCIGILVLFSLVPPLVTKALIDYVYPGKDINLLSLLVVFGLLVFFFQTFFADVSTYLDTYIHQSLSIDLRKKFFNRLLRLPMSFFRDRPVGDMMVRATDDIDSVVDIVAEVIPIIIKTILQFIFLFVICFYIDKNLTLLAMLGVPLFFIQTHFFAHRFADIRLRTQQQSSLILNFYQEKMSNIRTIKSFNQESYETDRLAEKLFRMFALVRESLFLRFFNSFIDTAIITLWTSFISWYAGYRVITGHISVGEIMAILVYLAQIHRPILDFGTIYKSAINSYVSIRRVDELLSAETEIFQDAHTYVLYDITGRIRFDKVSFIYPEASDYVLKDVDLVSLPGEITAICGASGAGKSTIIDLLLRFIAPTGGNIYIDEHNIKEVALITLRANISVVSQDVVVFPGTIRENLLYGCIHPDEQKMVEAARDADIHDFIMSLPDGYEAQIGEGETGFSGGQLQRLAIARALMRDVKILIFDEATSALDSISEARIYSNLKKHLKNKTILIISHRLSTLKNADKIYVLENNQVGEAGSFEELLKLKGIFYRFYQTALQGKEEKPS